ncbi:hypothetical protein LOK74_03140 [Brevibacillus humidisoli]|uniref:hypothetical protein n=1 Tax=Brevibacillus humidisoli TaxID=2895522 RepID=UPI001E428263|nr:hypothetical protein [Brevibacillus humidisoli]UFJ41543.1 hypothetical protein LOK74_03140 [Brevibacillus humidisoli]
MTAPFSPTFFIGSIRIGSVEGASCVNMGNNYPAHFQNHKKHNQGFGSVGGDNNQISGAKSVLDDADFLDMLNHSDMEMPDWVREMLQKPQNESSESNDR